MVKPNSVLGLKVPFILVVLGLCVLCMRAAAARGDRAMHFVPVDKLPGQDGMPDPFVKADGTRVTSKEQWPAQRKYLKAMLAHYQYGVMPPRPKQIPKPPAARRPPVHTQAQA